MKYKKFYHPATSSGVIRVTCGYGYTVDGVPANKNTAGRRKHRQKALTGCTQSPSGR